MRRHIHALLRELGVDHTTVYCAICGWWTQPHTH